MLVVRRSSTGCLVGKKAPLQGTSCPMGKKRWRSSGREVGGAPGVGPMSRVGMYS